MCLATPVKLKKVDGNFGYVDNDGTKVKVSLSLISEPKVGDWLLTHDKLAIATLPESEAKTILNLIKDSHCHCK